MAVRILVGVIVLISLYSCEKHEFETKYESVHIENDSIISSIYIPSAFKPNGDGSNDVFYPITNNVFQIQFKIYNRHSLIFENNGDRWDGSDDDVQASTVYNWTFYGVDHTGFEHKLQGQLLLND